MYRITLLLPKSKTPGAPRYLIGRPGAFNPDEFTSDDLLKSMTIFFDTLMFDDDFIISGMTMIGDASNTTLKHLMVFNNPVVMKKNALIQQDAYPVRQKGMHIFNMPSIMVSMLNLFKMFLNEKNKSRVKIIKITSEWEIISNSL